MDSRNQRNSRVVVKVPPRGRPSGKQSAKRGVSARQPSEWALAGSVLGAAALATFIALFLTSRPYNPMNATLGPQSVVPQAPVVSATSPSPTPSAQPSASQTSAASTSKPTPETQAPSPTVPDDAAIQAEIEKKVFGDPALAKLDVSTIVEDGKVTLTGSVKSAELKVKIERIVRAVKGVVGVDNQLVVLEATP